MANIISQDNLEGARDHKWRINFAYSFYGNPYRIYIYRPYRRSFRTLLRNYELNPLVQNIIIVQYLWCSISLVPSPSFWVERKGEKEGLGDNPGWKCPGSRNSATGVDYESWPQLQGAKPLRPEEVSQARPGRHSQVQQRADRCRYRRSSTSIRLGELETPVAEGYRRVC